MRHCLHWRRTQGPVTWRRVLDYRSAENLIERSFDVGCCVFDSEPVFGSWPSGALLLTVWKRTWEEDLPKKMTSGGSNIGSTTGAGSSGGPPTYACVSLTLEEQLANFKRLIHKRYSYIIFDDAFFESIAKVVKELRIDPWVDIESLPFDGDHEELLCGTTPLHWAVLMDDRTLVRYILNSRRVDINASTREWEDTALHYAIIGGNRNIVEDLLEYKADIGICNLASESILYYMVLQKDSMFDILRTILVNNVNMCDKAENTTLHHAAREGATDVVAYLLHEQADVNLHNQHGSTPLHYAAETGSLDVVTHLLQQNADVHVLDNDGWSPLLLAAMEGAMNIVSLLMKHHADVDALDKNGRNLLLHSIKNQRIDTSNNLIVVGVDVHATDEGNNNALHLAIEAHDREHNMINTVKLLREHDIDINAKNSQGYSSFFAAVAEGHTEVVKELLQNKEKIKLMEECNGQTAIQIAFDNGHEQMKRLLLECDDVSRYVDALYRDRQVYVDAANAILVGAALIASVTFASWLQPPLGYTTSYLDLAPSSSNINYVDVQHDVPLRAFWVFNTLSFYFAIATVVFGARSVLPRRRMFIKAIVVKLHQSLLVTSFFLACSVLFVIIAFGVAGCIVLIPTLKFQWYMIVPTIFGGVVCLISLGFLFKSMVEDNLEKKQIFFHLYRNKYY